MRAERDAPRTDAFQVQMQHDQLTGDITGLTMQLEASNAQREAECAVVGEVIGGTGHSEEGMLRICVVELKSWLWCFLRQNVRWLCYGKI